MSFPEGYFFITSGANGLVLDIKNASKKPDQALVVSKQKHHDNDSQLWSCDNDFIINKNSGLVLDIRGGQVLSNKQIIQYNRKLTQAAHNQRWGYRDGFIYSLADPNLVLDIKGGANAENTPVILYTRKSSDAFNQQWDIVPASPTTDQSTYQQPEQAYAQAQQPPGGYGAQQGYGAQSYGQAAYDRPSHEESYGQPQGQPYGYTSTGGYGAPDEERQYRPIRPETNVPRIESLEDAHREVYGRSGARKAHLSHELIAGAAAFEAMRAWEKRQQAEGKPVHHALAKELIAGLAMGEVTKLAEEHHWGGDCEEAKQAAAVAAERYYVQQYGGGY